MHNFRIISLILALLLMQSATIVHAIDHQHEEHSEWCQALSKAELYGAVLDAPVTTIFPFIGSAITLTNTSRLFAHFFLDHHSRAPPVH